MVELLWIGFLVVLALAIALDIRATRRLGRARELAEIVVHGRKNLDVNLGKLGASMRRNPEDL